MDETNENLETPDVHTSYVISNFMDVVLSDDEESEVIYAAHEVIRLNVPFGRAAALYGKELVQGSLEGADRQSKLRMCIASAIAANVYSGSPIDPSGVARAVSRVGKDKKWLLAQIQPSDKILHSLAAFHGGELDKAGEAHYTVRAYNAMIILGLLPEEEEEPVKPALPVRAESLSERLKRFGGAVLEGVARTRNIFGKSGLK